MADVSFSLLPRTEFESAYLKYVSEHPYNSAQHNGHENPYTHTVVYDDVSYYAYVRELVYHLECDKHFEKYWSEVYAARYADKEQKRKEKARRRKIKIAVVQLALLCIVGYILVFVVLPDIQSTSNDESVVSSASESACLNTPTESAEAIADGTARQEESRAPAEKYGTIKGGIVYINIGEKVYHRPKCERLGDAIAPISLTNADYYDYTPCTLCEPPTLVPQYYWFMD